MSNTNEDNPGEENYMDQDGVTNEVKEQNETLSTQGLVIKGGSFPNASFDFRKIVETQTGRKVPIEQGLVTSCIFKFGYELIKSGSKFSAYDTKHLMKCRLSELPLKQVFGTYVHGAAAKVAYLTTVSEWKGEILPGNHHPIFGSIPDKPFLNSDNVDSFAMFGTRMLFVNSPEAVSLIQTHKGPCIRGGGQEITTLAANFEKLMLLGKNEELRKVSASIGIQLACHETENRVHLIDACSDAGILYRQTHHEVEIFFQSSEGNMGKLVDDAVEFIKQFHAFILNH